MLFMARAILIGIGVGLLCAAIAWVLAYIVALQPISILVSELLIKIRSRKDREG